MYEILNRNKIAVKHHSQEESSQDLIIKIFENVVHDLRLKKERVENLENEDAEKSKAIDKLKDKNESLAKSNHKLQRQIEEQSEELAHTLRVQQEQFDDVRNNELADKEKYKIEVERLKVKQRNYEAKFVQMQDEINDCRSEIDAYRSQILELQHALRI